MNTEDSTALGLSAVTAVSVAALGRPDDVAAAAGHAYLDLVEQTLD
ncbi:hypothetical protein [Nonomuraea bangladeshensis]